MAEFRMPALGADMDVGTVLEWRVSPGSVVTRGDIVAVVQTDKADLDVEVFESGVVESLLVGVGETVPVGTPLATIATAGAVAPAAVAPTAVAAAPIAAAPVVAPVTGTVAPSLAAPHDASPVRSPLVRHLAAQLGVDAEHLHGTGPGGRVTRDDVEALADRRSHAPRRRVTPRARRLAARAGLDLTHVEAAATIVTGADVEAALATASPTSPAPPTSRTIDRARSMRQAVGRLMARSKRDIPHYYLSQPIELSSAMAWLAEQNSSRTIGERILPAAMLLKATALAAIDVPVINGVFVDDEFRPSPSVHLAVAVSLRGGGLVAPAVHAAETRSLVELMAILKDLVQRARSGRLSTSEMSEGTLTVTNLGDQGVAQVFPVITPPQVATIGFGRVAEAPWAHDGMVGARPVVWASLAADHRVSDGHDGARFLAALDDALHHPEGWS